jgi:hypothetical protein
MHFVELYEANGNLEFLPLPPLMTPRLKLLIIPTWVDVENFSMIEIKESQLMIIMEIEYDYIILLQRKEQLRILMVLKMTRLMQWMR